MHVEKSPLKINEKQTYFNEKHKKNNNPEKTADLTVQPGEPYSDLNKIFILFKSDIVPSAAMECWHGSIPWIV